ncbi:MAG: hypothetical protein HY013_11825, partial [Candidatus Solibacter usitatus]|nr:hypothetical protein [Candidatus Solibacter usitatus]
LFTTAGEKKARGAIEQFERVHGIFAQLFPALPESARRSRIVAFQSDRQFRPYQINEFAAAYYAGDRDQDYIVMHSAGAENLPIAIHEYSHLVMRRAGLHLPVWLSEGLADIYSTLAQTGGKILLGAIPPSRYQVMQSGQWLDIATLLAVDQDSPHYNEKKRAGLFYAQSWALTHMLYLGDGYRQGFGDFLLAVASGTPVAEALPKVYKKAPEEVHADLREYLRSTRFRGAVLDAKVEKSGERPALETATKLEIGMALAHLLALTGRKEEARRAYEDLSREHPRSPEIAVAQARMAWREHDLDALRRHFARAVELGTGNARVYVDYARLLEDAGGDEASIRALLQQAVELQPDLGEAHQDLGYRAMREGRYEEALRAFGQVRTPAPEQVYSMHRAMSYASYRLGRREEAIRHATAARKLAKTTEEIQRAAELLEYAVQGPPATLDSPVSPDLIVPKTPQLEALEGTLVEIECQGEQARFHLLAAGERRGFLVRNPNSVLLKNSKSPTLEFACGPQPPRHARVEWIAGTQDLYSIEWK